MLAFLVIKIEYRRALQRNVIPALCPPVDLVNPYGIPLPCEFLRIHPEQRRRECILDGSVPARTKPTISTFRGGGWRTLRRGTGVNPCTIKTRGGAELFEV